MKIIFFLAGLLFLYPTVEGRRRDVWSDQDVAEFKRVQETNSRILAESVQNIQSLRQELQLLKGTVEEIRHFFEEETKKNEKLLRDFDYRLTGIEERISLYGEQLQDFLSKGAGSPARKGKAETEEDSLYRRALAEINLQNFKQAIDLFDQFLKNYPRSSLADNAQYWKGEAFYASKQFPQAILEFQQVLKKYPKSEKVSAAVLKQGYAFFETGNYLDAKAFLQKVVTDFPGTDEAAQAKERVEKINAILVNPPSSPLR